MKITVLVTFVHLILLDVKRLIVVPLEGHGVLESEQAVVDSAFVTAVAFNGVSVGHEFRVIRAESSPRLISRLFQNDDHKTPH